MTKASEFREYTDDVLEARLIETKDELFKIRFTHATGQLDKYHRISELRRDVARIEHPAARARDRGGRGAGVIVAEETDKTEQEARKNARKVRDGIAVSTKMDKTVVVAVTDRVRHPRYRKTVQRTKRFTRTTKPTK